MPEPSPTSRRRGRLFRFGAAFVVLLAVAGYLVVQYVTGGAGAPGCKVVSADEDGASYEFTPEQAVNAATIAAVGTGRDLPERAVAIALATALQESALRNIDHGDRDSLGLFQQRPSQGWGTEKQIMDPTYSAGIFYDHLVKVDDYTKLPLTVAAQRVQRSGFPDAYAKHEPDATLLAAALTGRSAATLTCEGRPDTTRVAGTDPVRTALARDFGQDVLEPAGAVVGDKESAPTAAESGGRTLTLPVTENAEGWQLAHWAVANASALRIERVTYAGREWTAGNTDSQWRAVESEGAAGAEKGTGSVRIVTAR
ncbi:heavy metal transporter [Streptomyces sp. P17]|uniref:heavy metal transporter n=1 Tax=Streptomyces sp. P17 TaxID=3074716 RepID=UPI0028F43017|nr:heavy metal transporter [Streptomyces sp. P17]MDT9697809.1 heavy metal transporter [Streptomyces sp. P17]